MYPDLFIVQSTEITIWLALAAGLKEEEAKRVFADNPARAERSCEPIRVSGTGCQISLFFVVRSFDQEAIPVKLVDRIAPFAPGLELPFLEIREANVKITGLNTNNASINNLRWDFDLRSSFENAIEPWVRPWQENCGFNPAHPAAHFHVNFADADDLPNVPRPGDRLGEFRLATGLPNPLSFIISLGVWLAATCI